ncbi:MAG TPA: PQQ-binding-like beta-propeller repeat protein [Anaerolineales bacterium]
MSTHPLERAKEAIQQGDTALARRILVAFLEKQPASAAGWRLLAQCVEKESETIFCLERALKLDPGDEQTRRALTRLHGQRGSGSAGAPQVEKPSATTQPVRVAAPAREFSQEEQLAEGAKKPGKGEPLPLKNGIGDTPLNPYKTLRNWPLALGLVLVALVLLLAIAGPSLAPRDPLEEHNIFQIEGQWQIPPLNPLTPGYPFGTDNFGRDLYSRLLWAVRPTMVMVSIVAAVRLLLGLLFGLLAGWLNGRPGRSLDALIEATLSVPILLVALGAIAVVGVELGIWAFILGLSLTGWVETAQLVREQTRIVKGQVYVEAAHALGASNRQILLHHVLKQISPMLVMLFAFEVSSTLMATAGLGFLGYYIGGDVWVTVRDFVARRISGMPELGQMLATSWVTLTRPWAMVAVGTLVFTTVLGFNLVGEGLRLGLNLNVRRRGIAGRLGERAGMWFDQHVWHPAAQAASKPAVRTGLAVTALLILIGAGGNLLRSVELGQFAGGQTGAPAESTNPATGTPSGEEQNTSPGAGQEPAGETSPTPPGERFEPSIAWEIADEGGFDGGPALSPNQETLYAVSGSGTLYAISLEGEILWQLDLLAGGVGTPALDAAGDIYAADREGGLNKVSTAGEVLWRFQSQAGDRAHSGPVIGPDGVIYYTVGTSSQGTVQAVSPDGQDLWATPAETAGFFQAPALSASGEFVFLKEDVFSAETGERIELESEFRIHRFFTGLDGKDYLVSGNNVVEWQREGQSIEFVDIAQWDSSHVTFGTPSEVGVTAEGQAWLLYTSPGGSTSLMWVTMDDQALGKASYRFSSGKLVARLPDLGAILCGNQPFEDRNAECAALPLEAHEPLWNLRMPGSGEVQGGFWLDERLYLTTSLGKILAIAGQPVEAESETAEPGQPGLVWSYSVSEGSFGRPVLSPDGTIYLLMAEEKKLHILGPDGQLRATLDLEAGSYIPPAGFNLGSSDFSPVALPDGTLLVLSETNSVFAVSPQGSLLWEAALEAEPAQSPKVDGQGRMYLTDSQAGLYTFDSSGLLWRFQSEAAPSSANGLAAGPDGSFYYVVTNRSMGIIQAVSSAGQALWATQVKTSNFYDELQVSPDGQLIALDDDLFDAQTGERLAFELPVQVDEYIFGEDGGTYLRSVHTVMALRQGPGGIEIFNSAAMGGGNIVSRPPEEAQVDRNGVIWLYYRENLVWLSQDGQVLGTQNPGWGPGVFITEDYTQSRLVNCHHFLESETLECLAYAPGSDKPVWKIAIPGIPFFIFGSLDGNMAFLSDGSRLQKVYLGEIE